MQQYNDTTHGGRYTWQSLALSLLLLLCAFPQACAQSIHRRNVLDNNDYGDFLRQAAITGDKEFSFLAGGHCYGAHENVRSTLAASSLYAAIPQIKASKPDFIFLLGDVVRDANDSLQTESFSQLTDQLRGIIRILPGNHDLQTNGQPPNQFPMRLNSTGVYRDQMLLLNTESLRLGGGKAMLEQIRAAESDIQFIPERPLDRNLFVFSHRLLWALTEPGFQEMDDFANEPFASSVSKDTVKMVYEAILKLAGKRPIHWFSGDIGARWSENVFYGASADSSRHFYAAGLGDCPDDAFWHVQVDSLGHVAARVWMLNGTQPKPLKYYGLDGWRERMHARREAERIPLSARLQKYLLSLPFWAAFGSGCIVTLALRLLIQRWLRAKR
jgi:Calcineurin-like phosphoesterase